nr:aminodeoxychorismate synthase, component I [Xanthomonadales bacterium]NIX12943.1 aminodeoxychorismate synthase, component I [Xanthomonadales bacterium]
MSEARIARFPGRVGLLDVAAALPEQYPYLLDSAATGPLGSCSLLLRRGDERPLVLERPGLLNGPGEGPGFLDRLDRWYRDRGTNWQASSGVPFSGGWFVYLGYELAVEIEPVLDLPSACDGLPTAFAQRCTGAVIEFHDHGGRILLAAESENVLHRMQEELSAVPARQRADTPPIQDIVAEPAAEFESRIGRIHHYLRSGDVFQVNVSRGWKGSFDRAVNPLDVYRNLREHNPAPF